MFGRAARKRRRWPAFLVRLLCELSLHQFDGGEAQVGQQQLDARHLSDWSSCHAYDHEIGVRRTNSGQLVVGGELDEFDGNVGNSVPIRLDVAAQSIEIGQSIGVRGQPMVPPQSGSG